MFKCRQQQFIVVYNLTTVSYKQHVSKSSFPSLSVEHYPMTGDESGDLALALGLFAFLFTVGLCIILRKVPHFVWKRLTDPKESLYAVSAQRKLKKAPSRLRQGVKRRLNSHLSEVVQEKRYVTYHP